MHKNTKSSELNEENREIQTKFKPLNSGTTFKSKIRFFNLKPIEIGALLSAITFHGNSETFRHSLGGAKPLGYGKVKIEVSNLNNLKKEQNEYLKAFEEEMEVHHKAWLKSDVMQQLFGMANASISSDKEAYLKYPELEPSYGNKSEFLKYNQLPSYQNNELHIKSIVMQMTPQPEIDLTEDSTMKHIEDTVKKFIDVWDELSDSNKDKLYKKLMEVYENHRASKRRIDSNHVKTAMIPVWLGKELSKKLYHELTKE